jgi:hypothetical protein
VEQQERPTTDAAVAVVVVATRSALAIERGEQSTGPVDWASASPADVSAAVQLHRVTAVVMAHAQALEMPASLSDSLREALRVQTFAGLRLAGQSLRAVDAVAAAGLPVLLFKGVALSAASTGSLTARGAGDIDLLVRPEDVPAAHDALTAAGWEGEPMPPAGRWRSWYLAMRRERSYVNEASSIDLHWRIGWHTRPLPSAAILLDRAGSVAFADREVPTLAPPDAVAAACYHATVDRYARLKLLVDVARLVSLPGASLPADAHWRLRRVVAEAVTLTSSLLGPLAAADRFAPPGHVDPMPLLALWRHASVRHEWLAAGTSMPELVAVYRDSARFAGAPAAVAMALTDALAPPERITPGMGPVAIAGQVGAELADLFTRRLLRRSS